MFGTLDLDTMLRACKAAPTDDQVRRVLADAVEDAGDAERAEFVRLQLDPPNDWHCWDVGSAEREARQLRLIRKHIGTWLGGTFTDYAWFAMPGAEQGITTSAKFERGLAFIQLGEEPLRLLPLRLPEGAASWLESMIPTRTLDAATWRELCRGRYFEAFSHISIGWEEPETNAIVEMLDRVRPSYLDLHMADAGLTLPWSLAELSWFRPHILCLGTFGGWAPLTASAALSEVRTLSLGLAENSDTLREIATAPHLGQLQNLRCSGDGQPATALRALFMSGVLTNLERLDFTSWNGKGSAGLATALQQSRSLGRLHHLNLFMNPLTDADAAILAEAPVLATVRDLRIHSCGISDRDGGRAVLRSPILGSLERLDLSCNPIGDGGIQALTESPHLPRLRSADLCRCAIGEAGLRALARSPLLAQLECLDLSLNPLGAGGPQPLAIAGPLPNLRNLEARQVPGNAGWQALFRSATLDGLVRLDLSGCGLNAADVAFLVDCPGLSTLRNLSLSENPLGVAGAQALAAAPWLPRLVVLHLDECALGDDGLIALLETLQGGTLAELWVIGNGIGPHGGRALLEWPGLPHLVKLWVDENLIGDALEAEIAAVIRRGPT